MSSRSVDLAIRISADAAGTADAFDKVSTSARAMSDDVERAGRTAATGFDSAADAADHLGGKTSQAAGGLGDLGGALAAMPGPLGALGKGMEAAAPAIMGVTGAADLANLALSSSIVTNTRARLATLKNATASRVMTGVTKAQAVATRVLNAVLRANPIGLLVTAILLAVAVFTVLYRKNETFRNAVQAVMRAARTAVGWVVDKLGGLRDLFTRVVDYVKVRVPAAFNAFKSGAVRAVEAVTAPFRKLYDLVWSVIDAIRNIKLPSLPSWVPGVGSRSSASRTAAPSTSLMRTTALAAPTAMPLSSTGHGGGLGGLVQITVNGALDPDAVARQIGDLLDRRRLRLGQA